MAAKSYPARRPTRKGRRATRLADYDRRGSTWVYGAFEPDAGLAYTEMHEARDSASFVAFLHGVLSQWPTGELHLILDNLSTHHTKAVKAWAEANPRVRFVYQPPYAPWLNLIEPWWKTLRNLALKGRCFATKEEVQEALRWATCYWNAHRKPYRWRKPYPRIT